MTGTIAIFNKAARTHILTSELEGVWRTRGDTVINLTHHYKCIDGTIYITELQLNERDFYQMFHTEDNVLIDMGSVELVNRDMNLMFDMADKYYSKLPPNTRSNLIASVTRLIEKGIAG